MKIENIKETIRVIIAVIVHTLILIMKLIGKVIGVPVIYFLFLIDKIFKVNTRACTSLTRKGRMVWFSEDIDKVDK